MSFVGFNVVGSFWGAVWFTLLCWAFGFLVDAV